MEQRNNLLTTAAEIFVADRALLSQESNPEQSRLMAEAFCAGADWEYNRPDEVSEKLQNKIALAFDDKAIASLKKALSDIYDDAIFSQLEYSLGEDIASNLSGSVQRRAFDAVQALLAGNEAEMLRYLGITPYWDGRKPEHIEIIHGQLFETESIRLRREIVTKHAGLIANERIKDLEAQLAALLEINRRQEVRIAELLEERR